MPRDDALIRMVGGAALAAVAKNLQEASPAFRRKMPKALREAIEPARVAVEADLRRRLPHHVATVRSVIGLRSAGSSASRPALFVGFVATMPESDFSGSCIGGYGSSPSRRGPSTPKGALGNN